MDGQSIKNDETAGSGLYNERNRHVRESEAPRSRSGTRHKDQQFLLGRPVDQGQVKVAVKASTTYSLFTTAYANFLLLFARSTSIITKR